MPWSREDPVKHAARDKRYLAEVADDSIRAARLRAQKRQWWREHRAKRPIRVLVAP